MIRRTLINEGVSPPLILGQGDLLARSECLILLGEAGMGKTSLTTWLEGQEGVARCTARQLLNRPEPAGLLGDARLLVIDALDEAVARQEGDAVDGVLRKLGQLGYPRFILTCRAADWRSATGRAVIAEQYAAEPLELILQPFSLGDAQAFLAGRLGAEAAEALVTRYKDRKLADLLGNPQTLTMLAEVAEREDPPASIGALFARYVDIAWFEHSDQHPDNILEALGPDAILDALGAGFAILLLTGSRAISRVSRSKIAPGDVALSDAAALPSGAALGDALRSRLTLNAGPERFTWPHKRIAEFLGARWLARQADTPRKRRRLLALFHDHGLVPASLRGLHAWLAWNSPDLAPAVIAADPMGVIEYGDADALAPTQGMALLAAMQRLAADDPWFMGRGALAAQGLVQPSSIEMVRRLIKDRETPVRLRLLLLQQLVGSSRAAMFEHDLQTLMHDAADAFILRREAAKALLRIDADADWPSIVGTLREQATDDALRLGLDIVERAGYARFGEELMAALIVGLAVVDQETVGLFWRIQHDLPDAQLAGILDHIAAGVRRAGETGTHVHEYELTALVYTFAARRVELGGTSPARLWGWLEPFADRSTYQREGREKLDGLLRSDHMLRRAVQRHVLFEIQDEKTLYMRGWDLTACAEGLAVTADDVCHHLAHLGASKHSDDAAVERWKDLVQLVRHGADEGREVREAAQAFAAGKPELLAWLEALAAPRVFEWQITQEKRRIAAAEAREVRRANHRAQFGEMVHVMRGGGFAWLSSPANAYLKLHSEADGDLPAHDRISEWLGPEIASAAHQGFEAFLLRAPPWPSAEQIAANCAAGVRCHVGPVLVAALAERRRSDRGFADLSDERVTAGLYALYHSPFETHAGIDGLQAALEAELESRGLREATVRGWIEPQLAARSSHVRLLHSIVRDEKHADLAGKLVGEWLLRFPDLPETVEFELIDYLIRYDRRDDILHILNLRRGDKSLSDERRRSWDAIDIWLDFESASLRIDAAGTLEPELLWHLRARLGGGRWMGEEGNQVPLSPRQLEWIVSRFRGVWPAADMPGGGSEGHSNPWDAADYLRGLMARLGNEISDDAIAGAARLRGAPEDGYSEYLRNISAEQRRKRVEESYAPITLAEVTATLRDDVPRTAADLQSVIIEELAVLARRLLPGGDNANPIMGFYASGSPKDEESCRDHLLTLLRGQLPFSIQAEPEGQAADGKANDIACLLGTELMVPVEVKGQWHPDLWQAADTQLDRLYASDWRADRRGIYLVLWFGSVGKKLKPPPAGTPTPGSAEELRTALIANSAAAQSALVEIVVLDLGR